MTSAYSRTANTFGFAAAAWPAAVILVQFSPFARGEQVPFNVVSSIGSDVNISESAFYECTFRNLWTYRRHPTNYPRNAYWKTIFMLAHSEEYQLWSEGELASPGVREVSQTGSIDKLLEEYYEESQNKTLFPRWRILEAAKWHTEDGRGKEVESDLPVLDVDADHPFVSTLATLKPYPDSFSGFIDWDAPGSPTKTPQPICLFFFF
mmetsp:Transcript_13031/g.38299  ORF Transcript_13031/g.38299 Transcript_13031/m.38299 type:complete len:207 (-) Transcript_13031:12-632(-)